MSIIHDALNKAQREREPSSPGLPLYRETRTTRRRWKGFVAASLCVGAAALGALSAWMRLPAQSLLPSAMVSLPLASVNELDRAAHTDQRGVVRESTTAARRPEAMSQLQLDEKASASAPEVHDTADTAESAFTKARKAESDGQWDQAIHRYRQAIALNPALLEARNNLGTLFIHQRQIAAAIEEFQAALAIDSNYALARNNLGSAYLLRGEEGRAIQEFLAAIHLDGAYVSPYYNLASLYARRGDVGQSMAFLTRAQAIEPAVLSWLQDDPDFDGIRRAPEFQRLQARKQAGR
jgi:tetratricopeptide (TPR) repeat protein